jgi:transposase
MITASIAKRLRRWHFVDGMSIRGIAERMGLSRTTVKKWLRADPSTPVIYQRAKVAKKIDEYAPWLDAALFEDSLLPVQEQRTARVLFQDVRSQGFSGCYSRFTEYVSDWRRQSMVEPPLHNVRERKRSTLKQDWMEWLYGIEHGPLPTQSVDPMPDDLLRQLTPSPHNPRKRMLTILAKRAGFSTSAIARHLGISQATASGYLVDFESTGGKCMFQPPRRKRKSDDPLLKDAVFSLLHEPPSLSGYNRTTWRMEDLQQALKTRGLFACGTVIHTIIKDAGFRWRAARVVLTSNDPHYREKLEHVQAILSNLKDDEKFFSIDEFGPFAIKMKAGRVLVSSDVQPTVPQWQKSKGWLIATAALELSTNQVTHFYSRAKNTTEMIRMAGVLLDEYQMAKKLYLSWDAASWHMSKELLAFVEQHNLTCEGKLPVLELAPLPASAQFLNVIESVFSGMARAIIHSSDYQSVKEAQGAIDRYFTDRNEHYRLNPKKAGKKIWGLERTSVVFSGSNNCKDPAFR